MNRKVPELEFLVVKVGEKSVDPDCLRVQKPMGIVWVADDQFEGTFTVHGLNDKEFLESDSPPSVRGWGTFDRCNTRAPFPYCVDVFPPAGVSQCFDPRIENEPEGGSRSRILLIGCLSALVGVTAFLRYWIFSKDQS